METIFVTIDQETKLVLLPETTTERILLEDLLKKGSVTANMIKGPVDIMGKPAIGGVIIESPKDYDTVKAQELRPMQPNETHMEERREAEVL
jgi:hypothetical protein